MNFSRLLPKCPICGGKCEMRFWDGRDGEYTLYYCSQCEFCGKVKPSNLGAAISWVKGVNEWVSEQRQY